MKKNFLKTLLPAFILLFLLYSCKDNSPLTPTVNNTVDTLFPGTYLPAYPGSYWNYVDTLGNPVQIMADGYHYLELPHHSEFPAPIGEADTFFVPRWNDTYIFYKYRTKELFDNRSLTYVPFLDDSITQQAHEVANHYNAYYLGNFFSYHKQVWQESIIANMTVNGTTYTNVLHTRETETFRESEKTSSLSYYQWGHIYHKYYAPNIGLIRWDSYEMDPGPGTLNEPYFIDTNKTKSLVLVNYLINN